MDTSNQGNNVTHDRTYTQQPQTQNISFAADGANSAQGLYLNPTPLNPQYQERPQMDTSNQGNNGTHDHTNSGLDCQYNTVMSKKCNFIKYHFMKSSTLQT
jgi:hypothetical protein